MPTAERELRITRASLQCPSWSAKLSWRCARKRLPLLTKIDELEERRTLKTRLHKQSKAAQKKDDSPMTTRDKKGASLDNLRKNRAKRERDRKNRSVGIDDKSKHKKRMTSYSSQSESGSDTDGYAEKVGVT